MKKDRPNLVVTDYLVTKENFTLVKNEQCDYLETKPQPSTKNLSKYYESENYISHTDSKKGLLPFLYQQVKKYSLKKKVSLITRLHHGVGEVLDIGAGTGEFLRVAEERGWMVRGVEPSVKAREVARVKKINLSDRLDELMGNQYDMVTLWHVLEHLPNLEDTVAKIIEFVKPGGKLIVAVPNYKSYDANYYQNFWAAYDVPRHLWHFSQTSMKTLFSEKLDLIETRPMIFDSYYVSLLSEKYKTGRSFSLRAIWIGWLSNYKASKSKEYSSLIYCYKKPK